MDYIFRTPTRQICSDLPEGAKQVLTLLTLPNKNNMNFTL